MSKLLQVITIAVAGLVALAPGDGVAQTYSPGYPVCLYAYRWGGSDVDCSYTTLAQCQAAVSGRGGTCMNNPYLANAQMPGAPTGRRHRRAY
jgi:hypothetical protein